MNIIPLELLIIKKKAQKAVLEKISYIKKMVGIVKAKNYDVIEGDSFIYCDSEEACNGIVDSQVGDMLTKYSAYIEQIHITDQRGYLNYPLLLQAEIKIGGTPESIEINKKILQMLFHICDKAANLKLTQVARSKAEKNRKEVNKIKAQQKAEAEEEFLEEKQRQEAYKLAEKLKNMTPEQ